MMKGQVSSVTLTNNELLLPNDCNYIIIGILGSVFKVLGNWSEGRVKIAAPESGEKDESRRDRIFVAE